MEYNVADGKTEILYCLQDVISISMDSFDRFLPMYRF